LDTARLDTSYSQSLSSGKASVVVVGDVQSRHSQSGFSHDT